MYPPKAEAWWRCVECNVDGGHPNCPSDVAYTAYRHVEEKQHIVILTTIVQPAVPKMEPRINLTAEIEYGWSCPDCNTEEFHTFTTQARDAAIEHLAAQPTHRPVWYEVERRGTTQINNTDRREE